MKPLSRRDFMLGSLAQAEPARQPNVLVILASQWRAQAIPALEPGFKAPRLLELMRGGLRFDRAYASDPLAAPSRASLITGRYPHSNGVISDQTALDTGQPSIALELKAAGYATGFIGQWRLDGPENPGFVAPGPRRFGFDFWAAYNRGERYTNPVYFRDRPEPLAPQGFEPDVETALAVDFIEHHAASPFCLFLFWPLPSPPRPLAGPEIAEDLPLRENVPAELLNRVRAEYASYYSVCAALDANLGTILDALDTTGTAAGTIVVFTSDCGAMLGSHGLEAVEQIYEESARIPLVLRYPQKIAPAEPSQLPVSNVDLMPTLLGFCGAEIPAGVQGRDLSSLLTGGSAARPEFVCAEGKLSSKDTWRMIVRGSDKLVVNRDFDPINLFNLSQDPFEMRNLAGAPGMDLKSMELKASLKLWIKQAEDSMDASGLKRRPADTQLKRR